jgi:hypothetical protein
MFNWYKANRQQIIEHVLGRPGMKGYRWRCLKVELRYYLCKLNPYGHFALPCEDGIICRRCLTMMEWRSGREIRRWEDCALAHPGYNNNVIEFDQIVINRNKRSK